MSIRTTHVPARAVGVIVVAVAAVVLSADVQATSCAPPQRCGDDQAAMVRRRHDPVITAAGDIAAPDPSEATTATARLVASIDPRVALALGDNQYPAGEYRDFLSGYDPTWGRFKAITRPVLGNHEYDRDSDAAGYFRYFGNRAPKNYYSFDVGKWHLVALDSNCTIACCGAGSRQYEWLRHDLATSSADCTLAYWHHPRWSSGEAGGTSQVAPFIRLLAHGGADVVLTGHGHHYERFRPQTPDGEVRRNGIVEFVVGTGGKSLSPFEDVEDNSVVRNASSYGVLQLTLHPHSYEFVFKSVLRSTFRDAGSRRCH